ncbi:hypothetical protein CALCODRAFT_520150 [Calocera cornea HHB12733]|uniref:Uncharacterized protein n=1 Tax=Calocera cornea HHB12733 TaxID=1353952 RepID=A0A165DQJ2_9BASI|nr:hypothetical protein CALCODRAFT_520150 [Calocera cornea HHB12733]
MSEQTTPRRSRRLAARQTSASSSAPSSGMGRGASAAPAPSVPATSTSTQAAASSSSGQLRFPVPPPTPPAQPLLQIPDPATNFNYHRGVIFALSQMGEPTEGSGPPRVIDQVGVRRWLGLAPSYLMHDQGISQESGLLGWAQGVHLLVGVLQVLHQRGELEWETIDSASRALAESWSAANCWTGMDIAKGAIQAAGGRLVGCMDPEDRTRYKGRKVYPAEE